jgi:hypothetical protein
MTTPPNDAVKVHVVQDDTNQPARPKQRVVILNSFPLNIGATPVQIAPDSPARCRLTISVNGGGTTAPVIALGGSQSDCEQAQANAVGQFTGHVAYVTGPNTIVDHTGNTALWACLIVAGTNPCVVSTIAENEQ